MLGNEIFQNLFVLELANNHLGKIARGLKIIDEFSNVVKENNIYAAIKLQFRDVDNFIHKKYLQNDERYIQKTLRTKLSQSELALLVAEINARHCLAMATPFDEVSVQLCERLKLPIIKIASSCIDDWPLLNRILATEIPVIISSGGASIATLDPVINEFEKRNIPLAINHCVSLYPTEDADLNLNYIDVLKAQYKNHVIGFSTHEYHDWTSSIMIAYAKGARTFERHIDIAADEVRVSPYCSLPAQTDQWFKAFKVAQSMCGSVATKPKGIIVKEQQYLEKLLRGIYAARNLPQGWLVAFQESDIYAAIPAQGGQVTSQIFKHQNMYLKKAIEKDQPIMLDAIEFR